MRQKSHRNQKSWLGQVFDTVMTMPVEMPASHTGVPGLEDQFCSWSSFLLTYILVGSRWWLKNLPPIWETWIAFLHSDCSLGPDCRNLGSKLANRICHCFSMLVFQIIRWKEKKKERGNRKKEGRERGRGEREKEREEGRKGRKERKISFEVI